MHKDWQNDRIQYCEENSSSEPPILRDLHVYTWRKFLNPRQLSGHLQGRFLSNLVQIKQPKCVLEIGAFSGYSTYCLAEALPESAELHSIEADEENLHKAQIFWKDEPLMQRVQWHLGEALTEIPKLNIAPDFVFVDADKRNYQSYLDACFPLLPAGGLMLFDNTLWSDRVLDPNDRIKDLDTASIHAFNQGLAKRSDLNVTLLPLRDGLTLVIKR
ncbi:MAG: O-methyltransferase [Bacteroidia bacterium]